MVLINSLIPCMNTFGCAGYLSLKLLAERDSALHRGELGPLPWQQHCISCLMLSFFPNNSQIVNWLLIAAVDGAALFMDLFAQGLSPDTKKMGVLTHPPMHHFTQWCKQLGSQSR